MNPETKTDMPDLTLVQKISAVVAGVPVIATFLNVFGVYSLSSEQESALTKLLIFIGGLIILFLGSDAKIRSARNARAAQVEAAEIVASAAAPAVVADPAEEILAEEAELDSPIADLDLPEEHDPSARLTPDTPEDNLNG